MGRITIEGRVFPCYQGRALSWDPGLYNTAREHREGFPRARAVLAELTEKELETLRSRYLKGSFDRMFGKNASLMLDLVRQEEERREHIRLRGDEVGS